MQLRILVPSGEFACVMNVERIVVMTPGGSFGLLPQRLDCATVLSPGLLTYATATSDDVHLALDAGVLIKTGSEVLACVRRAIAGADLGQLRNAVQHELGIRRNQERSDHSTLARLESGFIREFIELQRV